VQLLCHHDGDVGESIPPQYCREVVSSLALRSSIVIVVSVVAVGVFVVWAVINIVKSGLLLSLLLSSSLSRKTQNGFWH